MTTLDDEQLAILYLCGELSSSQRDEYELRLRDDEQVREIYLQTCQVFWGVHNKEAKQDQRTTKSLPLGPLVEKSPRKSRFLKASFASAVCLLLVMGIWWAQSPFSFSGSGLPERLLSGGNETDIRRVSVWVDLQEEAETTFDWDEFPAENAPLPPARLRMSLSGDLAGDREDLALLSDETEESVLPDWLIAAVELKRQSSDPRENPAPATPRSADEEESL